MKLPHFPVSILKQKQVLQIIFVILVAIFFGLYFYPKKCQEVTTLALSGDQLEFYSRHVYCYNIFDKKYWSIEKWSSIVEHN